MAQPLLPFNNMFGHPSGAKYSREPMEKQWWCVSCLTQIALDTHGRCSTCGSDAVDRILNLSPSSRLPSFEARDRGQTYQRLAAYLPWR